MALNKKGCGYTDIKDFLKDLKNENYMISTDDIYDIKRYFKAHIIKVYLENNKYQRKTIFNQNLKKLYYGYKKNNNEYDVITNLNGNPIEIGKNINKKYVKYDINVDGFLKFINNLPSICLMKNIIKKGKDIKNINLILTNINKIKNKSEILKILQNENIKNENIYSQILNIINNNFIDIYEENINKIINKYSNNLNPNYSIRKENYKSYMYEILKYIKNNSNKLEEYKNKINNRSDLLKLNIKINNLYIKYLEKGIKLANTILYNIKMKIPIEKKINKNINNDIKK